MDNIFGSAEVYTEESLTASTIEEKLRGKKIYCTCCACMSIYSEFLSWANRNSQSMVKTPGEADVIVVLSCQVTDIAVLNDLRIIRKLASEYPKAQVYVGGCLALRFDIALPEGVRRLYHTREDYTEIRDRSLINFEPPFWVPSFKEGGDAFSEGCLFRDMYPLRISVGCRNNCKYCTIKTTRGTPYELDPDRCRQEFLNNENVVLIADSPSASLLYKWIYMALYYSKPISLRNVEPQVAYDIIDDIAWLAKKGLLTVLHVPVQSTSPDVLKSMGRNVEKTLAYMAEARKLKDMGVFHATNIIIDYRKDGKIMADSTYEEQMPRLRGLFDYISWNPYWDGIWDEQKAESRYLSYIG